MHDINSSFIEMEFLSCFAGLIAITSTESLSQSELTKYEVKLRNYQNMTNIDENTFQEIWTSSLKKCKNLIFRNLSSLVAQFSWRWLV